MRMIIATMERNLVNDRIKDLVAKKRPAYAKLTPYQTYRRVIFIHGIEATEVK